MRTIRQKESSSSINLGNLKIFQKRFYLRGNFLSGAEFAVYAAEDIYTPDHQVDEAGNRTVIYPKDTLIQKVTTDEKGEAILNDLPLGTYRVVETKAPTGFVINSDSQELTFLYKDQNTPVVEETVEFSNKRQKVELKVVKEDAETGKSWKVPSLEFITIMTFISAIR